MVDPGIETVVERLAALALKAPELAEAADVYQRLLPALSRASAALPPISVDLEHARCNLESGQPIWEGVAPEFDPGQALDVFLTLGKALESLDGADNLDGCRTYPATSEAHKIRLGAEANRLDIPALLSLVIIGSAGAVRAAALAGSYDPGVLLVLTQNTLKAFLRAWCKGLEGQVNISGWKRSRCPFCGELPGLAEIRGTQGERWLRCLRCGAGWPYPNLQCAFCGCTDYNRLGILTPERDALKYSVATCTACKRSIKTITCFEPVSIEMLAVEDLATLALDYAAVEYLRNA